MVFEEERFKLVVSESIKFLAPYFGISKKKLRGYSFPSIEKSYDKGRYFDPRKNLLLFQEEDYKLPEEIGHEVGHYLHFHLNPIFWENIMFFAWNHALREVVAYFSELIYINRGNFLKRAGISLPRLARIEKCFTTASISEKRRLVGLIKQLDSNCVNLDFRKYIEDLEKRIGREVYRLKQEEGF